MKSFKQILFEVLRTPDRAAALVDRVHRNAPGIPGDSSQVPLTAKQTNITTRRTINNRDSWDFNGYKPDDSTIHEIPVNKILANQKTIDKNVLKSKIKGTFDSKEEYPEYPIVHKIPHYFGQDDHAYEMFDGHHRLEKERFLGNKTMKVQLKTFDYPFPPSYRKYR